MGDKFATNQCEFKMPESLRRIPQLDGLRGLAISLVLIWHFVVLPIANGSRESVLARVVVHAGLLTWSGVDLFFVLSGFLIGGTLIDAKDSSNYFGTFYVRRAFRILPIYLVLTVIYLLVWSLSAGHRAALGETFGIPMPWYLYFTFTQNFWLAHHELMNSTYLGQTWSLAVEEQFYLLLPMIVRVLPRQILLRAAVLLALSSTIVRSLLYLHYGPTWGTAAYTLIFSRADALMVGVICAALLRDPHWKELLISKRWITHASCTIFGLGVAVLTYKGWGMGTMPMCTLGFTCLALFYASILMLVTITPIGLMSRAFQARWLMWLGTISYGLYLFHGFAMGVVSRMVQNYPPSTADWVRVISTIAAVVASLCFAWLSWGYFESKMVQLGHRFLYKGWNARPSSGSLSV